MEIYQLKINHLTNPLGFRMTRTCFSWKVRGSQGKKQKDARIRIASDETMQTILKDTGYDSQADSLGYEVSVTLKPRTRYFWTVSVRTDAGEEEESNVQWFETAKMEEPWTGKWITCGNSEKRHPVFSTSLKAGKKIAEARLYICGLGLYEAYIDGRKIGDEYLAPGSNDYNRWVQYQTYDITGFLTNENQKNGKAGGRILSVLLGNGWYKSRFGFAAWEDKGFYGNEWKLIAEVHVLYQDGSEKVIGSDESWTVRRSGICFSNLYDGEQRDDTLPELPEEKAMFCESPKGALTERMSLPVKAHETFFPEDIIHTPAGETVLDMGQEFAGIFTVRIKEPRGTMIRIRTGEVLQNGNFYNENLRTAKSEYLYTSDGTEKEITPKFTYFGYRYVCVEGISHLKKEDFTGIALYSDVEETGSLRTGHEGVNRLISNTRWGLKSNFLDVPTDCPQRDERMGWTGDAEVFSPTACYLTDPYAFYAKYLYDMYQEQLDLDGKVPDVVPSAGVTSTACAWGDAAVIIPWNLYCFYGDLSILKDQYDSMKAWVDYLTRTDGADHAWGRKPQYGDWLALDNPNSSVDQVHGATDEDFLAELYYAVSAGLTARAAGLLRKEDDHKKYEKLSEDIFSYIKREYYTASGRCAIKTQTALLLTLKYHLSDNEDLVRKMLRKLFKDAGDKLKTGFIGTPILCDVLTENGMGDLAWKLLLNEDYPGWLHEISLGATTIWERWNSVLDDGSISSTGMNSLNHYSYGSVTEWIFRYAAGICPDTSVPGFRKVDFVPMLNWKTGFVDAEYDSPAGRYRLSWKIKDPTHVEIKVSVPFGCTASLDLPKANPSVFEQKENPMLQNVKNGKCMLTAGEYFISYRSSEPLKKIYTMDTPISEIMDDPDLQKKIEKILPMGQVPDMFWNLSFHDFADRFGTRISKEELEEVESVLAK
ncbi:MAG TPA: family 78 glycoside hydrolase catalytic domain [Lachnospiraceae bacterium]|nr:family 78 glycoside hydrolase catalytic domain [Lachnospiraceae bacterium]